MNRTSTFPETSVADPGRDSPMRVAETLALLGPMTARQLEAALSARFEGLTDLTVDHALALALERKLVARDGDVFASALPSGSLSLEGGSLDADVFESAGAANA